MSMGSEETGLAGRATGRASPPLRPTRSRECRGKLVVAMGLMGWLFGCSGDGTDLRSILAGHVEIPASEREALRRVFADVPARRVTLVVDGPDAVGTTHRVHVEGGRVVGVAHSGAVDGAALGRLSGLRKLRLARAGWTDLRGVGPWPELLDLDLVRGSVERLDGLGASCPALRALEVSHAPLPDLRPLGGVANLEVLRLAQVDTADLETAPRLPALRKLILDGGAWSDLGGLRSFDALEELGLYGLKALEGLQPVADLPALRSLTVEQSAVRTLGLEGEPSSLEHLELSDNRLLNVELARLPRLRELEIHEKELLHVTLEELPALETADLQGEGIHFDEGHLEEIAGAGLPSLAELDVRRQRIAGLGALPAAPALRRLRLDRNPVGELAGILDRFPSLGNVTVRGTAVREIPDELVGGNVVVDHDPREVEAQAWEHTLREAFEQQRGSFVESLPGGGGRLERRTGRCSLRSSTFSTPRLRCSGRVESIRGLVILELVKVDPLSPFHGPNVLPLRAHLRTESGTARLYLAYEADFVGLSQALSGWREKSDAWFRWGDGRDESDVRKGFVFAEAEPGRPGSTSGRGHVLVDRVVVWLEGLGEEGAQGVEYVLDSPLDPTG